MELQIIIALQFDRILSGVTPWHRIQTMIRDTLPCLRTVKLQHLKLTIVKLVVELKKLKNKSVCFTKKL